MLADSLRSSYVHDFLILSKFSKLGLCTSVDNVEFEFGAVDFFPNGFGIFISFPAINVFVINIIKNGIIIATIVSNKLISWTKLSHFSRGTQASRELCLIYLHIYLDYDQVIPKM
jgi:hypothetical protein